MAAGGQQEVTFPVGFRDEQAGQAALVFDIHGCVSGNRAEDTAVNVIFMVQVEHGIEELFERLFPENAHDLAVGFHEFREGAAFGPALHGQALHGFVGFLAGMVGLDESGEHALGEVEPVGAVHVLEHAVFVNHEVGEQAAQPVQGVVGQNGGIGHNDALHRGVADIALMPEGLILKSGQGIGTHNAGEAAEVLGGNGVFLVGHGRGALLALGEAFLHFKHLGALQMPELDAQALNAAGHDGDGGEEMGVAVALHNLGGVRIDFEAENVQGLLFNGRGDNGVGAHGAGNLANADVFDGIGDAGAVAHELGVEAGHLEAEAGGLGVHAVGAADAQGSLVFEGHGSEGLEKGIEILEDEPAGLHQKQGAGRVNDVRGGAAEVDEAGVRADLLFQRGQKGDDVVAGRFLNGQDAVHVNGGFGLDIGQRPGGNLSFLAPGLADGQFDPEPCLVAVFERPDLSHFGPGVTFNHGCFPPWAGEDPLTVRLETLRIKKGP